MKSIIICGVGGQGVLTASDLLSDGLMEAGFTVKKSEVHGMSQRGGDVISTVKFGEEVYSPLPSINDTDYIVAFEKLEALRNINYLSEKGVMIVNDFMWEPLPVSAGLVEYPGDVLTRLKEFSENLIPIQATEIAKNLGNFRAANVVLLGVLAACIGIDKKIWLNVIRRKVPEKFLQLNLEAFEAGFSFTPGSKSASS